MKDKRESINPEELKHVIGGADAETEGAAQDSGNNGDSKDDNLTSAGTETDIPIVRSRWAMLG